jgi:D-methionine transport system permease protein
MSPALINLIALSTWQTIYMVAIASAVASCMGIPLGIILFITAPQGIAAHPWFYKILGLLVNALRSIPFIILLVAIIPFTRFIVGTTIGTMAAIVPLTIGAIPFIGRIVENALEEVPHGLVEAAFSMGASLWQIITKVLLPEALPAIVRGITITVIAVIGFSAMAGAVGGGGLGDVAIQYGYQQFNTTVMLVTVILLIILVQIIQVLGNSLAKLFNKR